MIASVLAVVFAASPQVSPELSFADPTTTPLFGSQYGTAVSFDGTNVLVAMGAINGISLRRYDPAGNPIDAQATVVPGRAINNNGTVIRARFNGTNHLVVWRDFSNLRFIRVSAAGAPIGSAGTITASAIAIFDLATDGTDWFVVWEDSVTSAHSISAVRVLANGTTTGFTSVASASVDGEARDAPSVAFNGTHYLVTWRDQNPGLSVTEVVARRYLSAGTPVDATPFVLTAGRTAGAPAVAASGATWLVAFHEARGGNGMYGTRVSSAGAVLDPAGLSFGASEFMWSYERPVVAGTPSEWLLSWESYSFATMTGARAARVNSSGAIVGTPAAFGPTQYYDGWDLVPTSSGWMLGGTTQPIASDPQATVWVISASGTIANTAGTDALSGPNSEFLSGLSTQGGRYTAITGDDRTPPGGYSAQLDALGARVGAGPTRVVPTTAFVTVEDHPTQALILSGCAFYRINTAGQSLDATPISTGLTGTSCRAGTDGTNYLVVSNGTNLDGRFFTTAGAPVGAAFQINGAAGTQYASDVAFGGGNYVVLWSDTRVGQSDVYLARVTPAGAVLDGTGIPVAVGTQHQAANTVTFGGGVFLVTWLEGSSTGTLFAQRLDTSGGLLGTPSVLASGLDLGNISASVAWQGNAFFVTWAVGGTVSGQTMLADGTLLPTTAATLFSGTPVRSVALRSASANRALLAYDTTLDAGAGGANTTSRVLARLLTFGAQAPGQGCVTDNDCVAGSCVDGVCCRTACGGGAADCQVCNVSGTGVCSIVDAGIVCRGDAGVCDVIDTCDGVSATCTNRFVANSVVCRPAVGVCDRTENCSGFAATCPADLMFTSTTVCRAAAGPCDQQETCSGSSTSCGADVVRDAGTVCAPGSSFCDPADVCDGLTTSCAPVVLSGVACVDGDQCTSGEMCLAGVCAGGGAVTCLAPSECVAPTGCSADAGCLFAAVDAGARCDGGVCDAFGSCVGAGGGSAGGGSAAGGSAGGGSAAGGSAAGGSAAGGSAAGGSAAGGSAAGGSAAGGSAAGGSAAGGSAAGGSAAGGSAAGGSAAGGSAAGGSAGGSSEQPPGCGCSTPAPGFLLVGLLALWSRRRHRKQ